MEDINIGRGNKSLQAINLEQDYDVYVNFSFNQIHYVKYIKTTSIIIFKICLS